MYDLNDTIAAVASAPGGALRSIIRISGPAAVSLAVKFANVTDPIAGSAAEFVSAELKLVGFENTCPALVGVWPDHRSYTGQPSAEWHLRGSPPIVEAALATLFANGARAAKPGEFTLRAFLAGKIDLLQAEAVLGVIDSHTETELQMALGQLAGGLSSQLRTLREGLLNLLADLEAGLDFVDEDIEFITRSEIAVRLAQSANTVDTWLDQANSRHTSGERLRVVLAGLPNAGKSSLFNALCASPAARATDLSAGSLAPAAIVSDIAGTTRDYLTRELSIGETVVDLVDTAGAEERGEVISQLAQGQLRQQLRQANLILWCQAADLCEAERAADAQAQTLLLSQGEHVLLVTTKCDQNTDDAIARANDAEVPSQPPCDLPATAVRWGAPAEQLESAEAQVRYATAHLQAIAVSAHTDRGLAKLKEAIASQLGFTKPANAWVGMTAARARERLVALRQSLTQSEELLSVTSSDEFLAIELRTALTHLGEMTGTVSTDDILGRIFSRFCIGK